MLSTVANLAGLVLLAVSLALLTGRVEVGLLVTAGELLWIGYVLEHTEAPAAPPVQRRPAEPVT